MSQEIALKRKIGDLISEYEAKMENLPNVLNASIEAQEKLRPATTIGGTYGRGNIDIGRNHLSMLQETLRRSAWLHLHSAIHIDILSSAKDKSRFEQSMTNPPEFNIDNIRATFGPYIQDPRGNILRGLAETFCSLDQSYKSHEKVKIGVKGLPKRIIISGFDSFHGYGKKRLEDCLNALAAYQGKPLLTHWEINALIKDGDCMSGEGDHDLIIYNTKTHSDEERYFPRRGIKLKLYNNGNGHLIFEPKALKDINRALAEFYGDIVPDAYTDKPEDRAEKTDISKDLQYYPTSISIAEYMVKNSYSIADGEKILEPSCGCGRIIDAIKKSNPKADVMGIEYHPGRAQEARSKGHHVMQANFLECEPNPIYDRVMMNPPFYGKHYAKHINHALKFLKPDGVLYSILPASARYDHKLFEGYWDDLPVGSFSESGTNINTTILRIRKVS